MRMAVVAVAGAVAVPVLVYTAYRITHGPDAGKEYGKPADPRSLSKYPPGRRVYVTAPDAVIDPPLAEVGIASEKFPNILQIMDQVAEKKANLPALRVERDGVWKTWTWAQYRNEGHAFARSLLHIGFQRYSSVAILGFNSPEWFIAWLGAIAAGGKGVGVYTTNGAEACQYIIDHSESHVVVVEDAKQLEKILKVQDRLPTVKMVVVYNDAIPAAAKNAKIKVVSWQEFLEIGAKDSDEQVVKRIAETPTGQCCSLIYTSGTTGNPKAVMISHDNLIFLVRSVTQLVDFLGRDEDERVVSYLPLSHVAGQMLDIVMPIVDSAWLPRNITVSFARPDALKGTLVKTLQAVRPTIFLGVPRVWEKMVEGMKMKGKETKGLKKQLVMFAKSVGLAGAEARQVGGSGSMPWTHGLMNKLIYKTVQKALGLDKCKFAFSGAAPITRDTLAFLGSLGINVYEVLGMSESTAVITWSLPSCHKWGSVGFAIPGVEVRTDHVPSRDKPGEGEIVFRGRNVMMGYLKEDQKTKETIDSDGWLHSGDLGRIDENGLLYVTGRIKELIITAGGENIAPVPIEDELKKLMPGISNAMLVGDKRKYNIVLITLQQKVNVDTGVFLPELVGESAHVSAASKTVTDAQNDPAWKKYIEDGIKKYNSGSTCVSNAQKIQKFVILPNDFSIAGDELTGTLKLKRNVVCAKYDALIDSLYVGGSD